MLRILLQTLSLSVLFAGLVTITPIAASAEDAPNSRGAKKRKKKKKKKGVRKNTRKKAKKTRKPKSPKKKRKRTKAPKVKTAPSPSPSSAAPAPPSGPERGALAQSCISQCKKNGEDATYGGTCVTSCLGKIRSGSGNVKKKTCSSKCRRVKGKKKRRRCFKKCRLAQKKTPPAPPSTGTAPPPGPKRGVLAQSCMRRCKKNGKDATYGGNCVTRCLNKIRTGKGNLAGNCKTDAKTHCKKQRTNKSIYKCLSKLSRKNRRKLSKKCKTSLARHKKNQRKAPKPSTVKLTKASARIFMPGSLTKSKVDYEVSGNEAIADGCIGLGSPDDLAKNYGKARLPGGIAKLFKKKGARGGSVVSRADLLWPRGRIPFLISNVNNPGSSTDTKYTKDKKTSDMTCQGSNAGKFNLHRGTGKSCTTPTSSEKAAAVQKIRDAAAELTSKTALTLFEITTADLSEHPYYVDFQWEPNGKCWSRLGRDSKNGQPLKCDYNNPSFPKGTIMHELLHAAGFNHTQKRTDRGDHIVMQATTCDSQYAMAKNFYADYCAAGNIDMDGDGTYDAAGAKNTNSSYDLGSIMHYSSTQCDVGSNYPSDYAFVLKNNEVINGTSYTKGAGIPRNRAFLTPGDIEMIEEVYGNFTEANRSSIQWYCWWKEVEYRDNTGSRGSSSAKTRKCLKRCGVGSARTVAGRKVLNCRQGCYE